MGCHAEAKVIIIFAHFKGVGELYILHGPGAVFVFEIVRAVAHPDAYIALWQLAYHEREDIAALLLLVRMPLDGGVATDGGMDAAELVGQKPCCI